MNRIVGLFVALLPAARKHYLGQLAYPLRRARRAATVQE
jgi:hypothetical protein